MNSKTLNTIKERWKNDTFGELFRDWKWIFSYSAHFRYSIALYTFLGLLSSTLGLLSSLASKFMVDVVVSRITDQLWLAVLAVAGTSLLIIINNNLFSRVGHKLNVDMSNHIRSDVFNRVMEAGWQSLNQFPNGDILNRFHSDVDTVTGNAINWIPGVITSIYAFITTFIVIWYYSPVMSILSLGSAPLLLFMSRYLLGKQKFYRSKMMDFSSKIHAFETESLYGIDTIKSFGVMDRFGVKLKDLNSQYRAISLDWNMFQIRSNTFITSLNLLVGYAGYGYALFLLWTDHITYGTMMLFLQQSGNLNNAFNRLVSIIPGFINGSVSAHRVQELMDLPGEKYSGQDIPAEYFRGGLTLKLDHIDFSYENSDTVIETSDFEAFPGHITALVGPSGEGKTTVLRLILGIIEPSNGSCAFLPENGAPLPLTVESRALISYVPQGNTLLGGTIAENLRLARQDATEQEMIDALKLACAWDFVEKMPDGIDSQVLSHGKGLSEGQAQRISIARALLRNAPVLLMDEATSALDVETEKEVLRNILKKAPERTVIITTHRPTVLYMCSQVYRVLDKKITRLNRQEIDDYLRSF